MQISKPITIGVALLALLAVPRPSSGQGLMVSGYADFEAVFDKVGSTNSDFIFDNHHFNLIMLGKLGANVFAAAEVEYEHGGEEIALEYGYIAYTAITNLRIAAGKFIVPFGRFNKDLHPTWINKMPDRPHGFRAVFPQTYSDVGVWLSGAAPVGRGTRVTYDAFIVNGLMGDDGGSIRSMRNNDREKFSAGGRDDNKAVGGRLGLEVGPTGLDFGASIYTGNYLDDPSTTLTLTLIGADAAYHYRGLELRGEVVRAQQESTAGDLTKTGGYAQAAYLINSRFEPVIRFSMRDMPDQDNDNSRMSLGASYYPSPNAAFRLAYHLNGEKTGFEADNNKLIAQFTMMF